MKRAVAFIAFALSVPGVALAGQTGYTPPGGTTAQGATGGISYSPSALGNGWSLPSRGGVLPWRMPVGVVARPDQIRRGAPVYSTTGGTIGEVAYVDGRVAVVRSNRSALRLPLDAFGTVESRLLLQLTKGRFEWLAGRYGARR